MTIGGARDAPPYTVTQKRNQYANPCQKCGKLVKPNEGVLVRAGILYSGGGGNKIPRKMKNVRPEWHVFHDGCELVRKSPDA